jgi:BirA family biotin operon repressor/biotin-[acetyl-CoA-carboxylase] ligase
MMAPAFLNADEIRQATFVRHIEIHDTLGSTNDRAAELTREPSVELPALVVARHQTAGRGRGQNKWWAAEGALTFSLLLEPAAIGITSANWPQLSLTTAVAVCDALQHELVGWAPPTNKNAQSTSVGSAHPTLGIKWPNDVMLEGRKVCGILIESPGGAAPAKDRVIIGVGINVNNSPALSSAVAGGTALGDVTGRQHDLTTVLLRFLEALQKRLRQLSCDVAELTHAWENFDVLIGRIVHINAGTESLKGEFMGLADDGAAIIRTTAGERAIYSGTVRRCD